MTLSVLMRKQKDEEAAAQAQSSAEPCQPGVSAPQQEQEIGSQDEPGAAQVGVQTLARIASRLDI